MTKLIKTHHILLLLTVLAFAACNNRSASSSNNNDAGQTGSEGSVTSAVGHISLPSHEQILATVTSAMHEVSSRYPISFNDDDIAIISFTVNDNPAGPTARPDDRINLVINIDIGLVAGSSQDMAFKSAIRGVLHSLFEYTGFSNRIFEITGEARSPLPDLNTVRAAILAVNPAIDIYSIIYTAAGEQVTDSINRFANTPIVVDVTFNYDLPIGTLDYSTVEAAINALFTGFNNLNIKAVGNNINDPTVALPSSQAIVDAVFSAGAQYSSVNISRYTLNGLDVSASRDRADPTTNPAIVVELSYHFTTANLNDAIRAAITGLFSNYGFTNVSITPTGTQLFALPSRAEVEAAIRAVTPAANITLTAITYTAAGNNINVSANVLANTLINVEAAFNYTLPIGQAIDTGAVNTAIAALFNNFTNGGNSFSATGSNTTSPIRPLPARSAIVTAAETAGARSESVLITGYTLNGSNVTNSSSADITTNPAIVVEISYHFTGTNPVNAIRTAITALFTDAGFTGNVTITPVGTSLLALPSRAQVEQAIRAVDPAINSASVTVITYTAAGNNIINSVDALANALINIEVTFSYTLPIGQTVNSNDVTAAIAALFNGFTNSGNSFSATGLNTTSPIRLLPARHAIITAAEAAGARPNSVTLTAYTLNGNNVTDGANADITTNPAIAVQLSYEFTGTNPINAIRAGITALFTDAGFNVTVTPVGTELFLLPTRANVITAIEGIRSVAIPAPNLIEVGVEGGVIITYTVNGNDIAGSHALANAPIAINISYWHSGSNHWSNVQSAVRGLFSSFNNVTITQGTLTPVYTLPLTESALVLAVRSFIENRTGLSGTGNFTGITLTVDNFARNRITLTTGFTTPVGTGLTNNAAQAAIVNHVNSLLHNTAVNPLINFAGSPNNGQLIVNVSVSEVPPIVQFPPAGSRTPELAEITGTINSFLSLWAEGNNNGSVRQRIIRPVPLFTGVVASNNLTATRQNTAHREVDFGMFALPQHIGDIAITNGGVTAGAIFSVRVPLYNLTEMPPSGLNIILNNATETGAARNMIGLGWRPVTMGTLPRPPAPNATPNAWHSGLNNGNVFTTPTVNNVNSHPVPAFRVQGTENRERMDLRGLHYRIYQFEIVRLNNRYEIRNVSYIDYDSTGRIIFHIRYTNTNNRPDQLIRTAPLMDLLTLYFWPRN